MPPDISELSPRGPDGPKIRVKHFSQSSHKGGASYVFKGIYRYLDVFIAIYGYLFFIYLYLKITL